MKSKKRIVYTTTSNLLVKKFTAVAGQPEKIATLEGYCMVWNTLSSDRGGFKVRLLPGSATFTTPTHALYHHDYTHVIGNTANGTLRLIPDAFGVKVQIDLPDTTSGRDCEELVEGKYVTGMSFSMVTSPIFTDTVENGETIMNVSSFVCDEVTITPIPAFVDTTIGIKEDDVAEMSKAEDDEEDDDASEEDEQPIYTSNSLDAQRMKLQTLRHSATSL